MADWGLSDKGYYCPTYEEILAQKIKRAKELFGDDIATDSPTALGKLLRIEAAENHKLYEEQEKVYYSLSPVTATGISLDRLCALVGIRRNVAICAKHLIRVFGKQSTTIKAGALFRTTAGIKFYATADAVIENEEQGQEDSIRYYAEVIVQCADAGTSGNVTNINAPVIVSNDITEVQYYDTITVGENTESDTELRNRYNTVVEGMGSNTAASIIASVLKINGVHSCSIKNNSGTEDIKVSAALTVSPGTYAVIVYAGDDLSDNIAYAIYQKMPLGIRQSGTESVYVKDEAGENHLVKFTYVDTITVDVAVNCKVTSEFSKSGALDIKESIESYINSLTIGENLVWSRLYGCIYSVAGVARAESLRIDNETDDIQASGTDIIKCGAVTVTVAEV